MMSIWTKTGGKYNNYAVLCTDFGNHDGIVITEASLIVEVAGFETV